MYTELTVNETHMSVKLKTNPLVQWSLTPVLRAHCPVYSRCFLGPTHLIQINGSCWSRETKYPGRWALRTRVEEYWFRLLANAGYTPQDNRADFGPIFPLPTILCNVPIIYRLFDQIFPWCEVCLARKNVGAAPIANRKYSTC